MREWQAYNLIFLIFSFGAGIFNAHSQNVVDEYDYVRDILENIAQEQEDQEFNFETFQDLLLEYIENPLDLNEASKIQLEEFNLLNQLQINSLLEHIEKYGDLLNIYELQTIDHFDLNSIYTILPFVKVGGDLDDTKISFADLFFSGKHQVFFRWRTILEEQEGYFIPDTVDRSRYLGNKHSLYTRYKYNYGTRLSYGITAEKDAGEEFFRGSQNRGFDYYSAHLFLRDFGIIKSLAIGDYEVRIGQGLMFWSGFGFRKSAYVMDIQKLGSVLKQYTSVNENRFMRGAGITLGLGQFKMTAWGSHKGLDANIISSDTLVEEEEFTSFQESGFHRTQSEIDDKKSIVETIGGMRISYETRNLKVGISAAYFHYDSDLITSDNVYRKFAFSGNELINYGIDYNYVWRNFNFFGETALSDNGGIASLNGILLSLDPRVDLSVLYRHISKDYQSRYANSFAESSTTVNEQGIYFGIRIKPVSQWSLDAYFDAYKHPWLRFQADAPSYGTDYLLQLSYRPSKQMEMYLRLQNEKKKKNTVDNDTKLDFLADHRLTRIRYHLKYKVNRNLKLVSRIEFSFFNNSTEGEERGFLVYQDVIYKPFDFPLSATFRYSLFDTDSYDARIYAYEQDLLYVFSIPPFSDKGSRYYILLKYKLGRNIDIWLKFAQTYYTNRESVGSGLDEINANVRSDVRAQVRLRF